MNDAFNATRMGVKKSVGGVTLTRHGGTTLSNGRDAKRTWELLLGQAPATKGRSGTSATSLACCKKVAWRKYGCKQTMEQQILSRYNQIQEYILPASSPVYKAEYSN